VRTEALKDNLLAKCKYFTVEKYMVNGEITLNTTEETFKSVIVLEGCGAMEYENGKLCFERGDSLFIPAQNGEFKITGDCEIIVSYV